MLFPFHHPYFYQLLRILNCMQLCKGCLLATVWLKGCQSFSGSYCNILGESADFSSALDIICLNSSISALSSLARSTAFLQFLKCFVVSLIQLV